MDDLTIAMCLCIGNAVAWLLALYTRSGLHRLLWNVLFGVVGATLCALLVNWIGSSYAGIWLMTAGPICSLFAILAGQRITSALS